MASKRRGPSDFEPMSAEQTLQGRPRWVVPVSTLGIWLFGFVLLAGLLTLFHELSGELDALEARLVQETGGDRLHAIDQQMDTLRNRLHGLMADSVEIRLKSLERNLAEGRVSPEDLKLFDTLQNDLKALQDYAEGSGAQSLEYESREHPRYQHGPPSTESVTASAIASAIPIPKADMLKEISRLRTLLYLCLTGLVGTGGVLVGRFWIQARRPPLIEHRTARRPPLLSRRRSG